MKNFLWKRDATWRGIAIIASNIVVLVALIGIAAR
jgi:anti-sigma-K factor RskA